MKKKAMSIFLTAILVFSLAVTVHAEGDPNLEGGGGGQVMEQAPTHGRLTWMG